MKRTSLRLRYLLTISKQTMNDLIMHSTTMPQVVFGHCISDCSGTGSNAHAAQAVKIMADLKAYNNGAFSCNGGAFFWVSLHDVGGAWSDAVVGEVAKNAGCSGTSSPTFSPNTPACAYTNSWHPDPYSGWLLGKCDYGISCHAPSYDTELECCNVGFALQESGYCHSHMISNNSATITPTIYYHPDYSVPWDIGTCINTLPLNPWNSPTYSTQLACCKKEFGAQMSNACIEGMVNPPTQSPTKTGGPDIYYPDYSLSWEAGRCTNKVPRPSGWPTFPTMLACCQESYAGQSTRACKNAIPSNSTSPIVQNGTLYYADYSLPWDEGTCIKTLPIPAGSATHATLAACCAIAFAGQYSKACINSAANVTNGTNSSLFYPNYSLSWDEGQCINTLPIPSGWPTYSSILACCAGAYAGQWSRACVNAAGGNNPNSTQPLFYPDYSVAWDYGRCINLAPIPSGRPTYSTQLACCKAAYAYQQSKACIQALPSPPTYSPTKVGGPDIYYPDYSLPWTEGKCINTVPVPSGRITYTTKLACCAGAYAGQSSRVCVRS